MTWQSTFCKLDVRKVGPPDAHGRFVPYGTLQAEQKNAVWDAELEAEAAAGVADAQHHLSLALHVSAMKNKSLGDLVRAERLLRAAAAQGHAGAIATLEDWPVLKAAAQRRIDGPE